MQPAAPPHADALLPSNITLIERGWLNANVVLIRGERNILIDAGYAADVSKLEAALRASAGLTFEDIGLLLITHAHPDHIGAAAAIRARSNAEIAADEETAWIVSHWDMRLMWASYADLEVTPFPVTRVLRDREVIAEAGAPSIQTIYSPGHSRGGACFWIEPEKILVSSDSIRKDSFGVLNPLVDGLACPAQQVQTLATLEALGPSLILPGHGPAVTEVAATLALLKDRAAYLQDRPDRLAFNVMKAMLLVHLLHKRGMPRSELEPFVESTPWFQDYSPWLGSGRYTAGELIGKIIEGGALRQQGDLVVPTMER